MMREVPLPVTTTGRYPTQRVERGGQPMVPKNGSRAGRGQLSSQKSGRSRSRDGSTKVACRNTAIPNRLRKRSGIANCSEEGRRGCVWLTSCKGPFVSDPQPLLAGSLQPLQLVLHKLAHPALGLEDRRHGQAELPGGIGAGHPIDSG